MIQVSSLFPLFKEQGYRVCVNVSERGKEILESDPNVDELLVQEDRSGFLMIDLLRIGIIYLSALINFVQLSESIEGSLLLTPEREEEIRGERIMVSASKYYNLSKEEIHEKCNVNYMERTHDLAGLPHKFHPKFYPTDEEERRAKRRRKKIKSKYVILWGFVRFICS